MTNNSLIFWLGHYRYIEATFRTILSQLRLTAKIAVVKINKNITPQKIIKRS